MKEIETDDVVISYVVEDQSFSHAFGIERRIAYDITSIKVYVPFVDEWMDVTNADQMYYDKAIKLVSEHEREAL